MLRNYLKIIFRNIYKNRIYTGINILGLSLGFAVVILISIYIHFETSFDKFHTKSDRIYRPTYTYDSGNGHKVHWARIPINYINELPNEFPEIEHLVRFQNHERKYIKLGENRFRPNHVYITDNEVFEVFNFQVIAGDAKTALNEPNSIVITKKLARTYFGKTDVLNEELLVLGNWNTEEQPHKITAVIKDLPSQTHLPIDMLISFQNEEARTGWAYVYVLLKEGADVTSLNQKMSSFIQKHADEKSVDKVSFDFQPLQKIHLHSNLAREIIPNSDISYVRIFIAVGFFILIVALINYINLNGALILDRNKELSLRKILGSGHNQIASYLIIESVSLIILAMMIGSIISILIFPYFSIITSIEFIINPWIFGMIFFIVAVLCGLISGILPFFSIPRNNPLEQLKTVSSIGYLKSKSSFNLKRVLVTLQYGISILLIGSAFIAKDQFHYLNETNLGINREQILAIPGVPDGVRNDFYNFKERLLMIPGIQGVTSCMEVPSREIRDTGPVLVKGKNTDPESAPKMDVQIIDHDFLEVMDIQLAAGSNLPRSLENYSIPELTETYTFQDYLKETRRSYLINESAMRELGWNNPEEAIGQEVNWSIGGYTLAFGPIEGVVKDYHQESMKNKIDPTIMVFEPIWLRTFLIKVDTDNIQGTIQSIESAWDKLFPSYPIEYQFLDEMYEALYKDDRIKLQLLFLLSGLAIIISFIGLFGLISFSLKTRVKEIAIRKVLGANIYSLVRLFTREYLLILSIASFFAVPTSYYFINQWMQQFAYKTSISTLNYLWTVLIIGLLILIISSFQTVKTSLINPSETLKDE